MVNNYFDEKGKSLQTLLEELITIYYYDEVENNA